MTWMDVAADLLLGASCPGCGRPGWATCTSCRTLLSAAAPFDVVRSLESFPAVSSAMVYEGPVRRLVAAHKERHARAATRDLAELLALAVSHRQPGGPLTLVPVPSTRRAVRERGYDSVRLVAD
ncbi:MAG TPA: ComF family protein, partial [Propionibacteriaceae bacterium]|nr:ComF family protein [Propionibacteriaceae bacterium]